VKKIFAIIIFAFYSLNSASGKDFELSELLEIAEKNSENIKSAEFLAESQKNFADQQKYWKNPEIEYKNITGGNNFSISQTIPFYRKLENRFAVENAEYMALEAEKNYTNLWVKSEVFRLIYQYQITKTRIELAKKRLKRLELVNKYLQNLVLTSPTKKAQWFITKDRIRLVNRELLIFQNDLVQLWNAVNIFLNLDFEPNNIRLNWLTNKNYLGKKFYKESAWQNNLDLIKQKNLINKSKFALEYAKIEQMPDVKISGFNENNQGNSSNNKGVGIALSVPILNRNQQQILGANAHLKSMQASLNFQQNQLNKAIDNNINHYETLLKINDDFTLNNLDKIVQRLELANDDFKKGLLDFITYIELDSQEYQIIDATINNQLELAKSYSDLMLKIGNFLEPKNK